MQALLSRWSTVKQPKFKYGQGISSSDYLHVDRDATQLDAVPDINQVTKEKSNAFDAGPSIVAQVQSHEEQQEVLSSVHSQSGNGQLEQSNFMPRPVKQQQQYLTPSATVDEFGALPSGNSSQRAINDHQYLPRTESRLLPSKFSRNSMATSTMPRRPTSMAINATPASAPPLQPTSYGYTTVAWDHQMDVSRAVEVVMACSEQIRIRGLDSPLLFSSMALDLSHHSVTSLINSLVQSPSTFLSTDVKYANPHDLAAVIKWTLARLGRVYSVPIPTHERTKKKGAPEEETVLVHQRGFLELERYTRWAGQEKMGRFPKTAFASFSNGLSPSSLALLVAVFSILSSTTSYSNKNGMSPSRLSRLFGPLFFGLPEDETFEITYDAFVKAGNATEHLLLAYIRDAGTVESLPIRLAEHVRNYPAMLSTELHKPSRSVRGAPLTHVNRTVRLYSLDLVQTACEMDIVEQCPEWQSCCTSSGEDKELQLSDRYRKLLNIRGNRGVRKHGRPLTTFESSEEMMPYETLADKQWGDFMSEGFAAPDQSKLAFDLKESHRKIRRERPESVQWNQFEKSGFLEEEKGLESVLTFGDDLKEDIQRWPSERAELMKQLRKTSKMMPSFSYDTVPYVVSSPTLDVEKDGQWDKKPISRFDEVFAEVFADVLLGNGWCNRDEQTHRNANFVVVQYKSRPTASTVASQSIASFRTEKGSGGYKDDRSDAAWFVVEEIIPAQYRSELEAAGHKGKNMAALRKLNIFKRKERDVSRGSGVQSDPIPFSTSAFDELLKPGLGGVTKRMQLGRDPAIRSPSNTTRRDSSSTVRQSTIRANEDAAGQSPYLGGGSNLMRNLTTRLKRRTKDDEWEAPPTPPKVGMAASPSFSSADYETRSVHELGVNQDEGGVNQSRRSRLFMKTGKHAKRQSRDDSWLDVMLRPNTYRKGDKDEARRSHYQQKDHLGVRQSHTAASVRSITPVRSSSLVRNVPITAEAEEEQQAQAVATNESQALGLQLHPSPHASKSPGISPMSSVKRKPLPSLSAEDELPIDEGEESVSKDTISAAGWTLDDSMKESSTTMAPPTPPKDIKQIPLPMPQEDLKDVGNDSAATQVSTGEINEGSQSRDDNFATRLAHLKPLPSRASDGIAIDERERAREARIEAARERARELRANLKPVAVIAPDSEHEEQTSASTGIAPEKPRLSSSPVNPSELSSSISSSSAPKAASTSLAIDPFSKDRISGRVASVASKFGGAALKPITPPASTGRLSSSPVRGAGEAPPVVASAPPLPPRQADESLSRSIDSQEILAESRSNDYNVSVDQSEIYPEDAASNFSRDTTFEEGGMSASNSRDGQQFTPIRQGGSIAASLSSPSNVSDHYRQEDEDEAMGLTHHHRIPYQPGMPLSNLEEESESVLSGSNL